MSKPAKSRRSPEFKRQVVRAYVSGMSAKACAERFRAGRDSVKRWVEEAGVPVRTQKTAPREYGDAFKRRVVEAYVAGMSVKACAARFGAGVTAISAWVHAAGVMRDRIEAVRVGTRLFWEYDGRRGAAREKPPSAEAPEG